MQNRRKFIKTTLLGAASISVSNSLLSEPPKTVKPVVISTWRFGLKANSSAWKYLSAGDTALNASEKGVNVIESDPAERSVGKGGRPDRDGKVTLDACIMDHRFNIGSVACLEYIENPVSVARKVMEKSPHVMLVGEGALQFAMSQGFEKTNLLVPDSEKEWKEWLKNSHYEPVINIENHDTIGMLCLDQAGNLAGACTTSGLAWKMHGRVGDSPIIGAGLYIDNEVGGATATGHGEEVIRTVGSFRVVNYMKQGLKPGDACRKAVEDIRQIFKLRETDMKNTQIGFLALNKKGQSGGFALRKGFQYALSINEAPVLIDAEFLLA